MVAEKHPRLVPASYLDGAACPLPEVTRADPSTPQRLEVKPLHLLARLTPAERLVAVHVAQSLSNQPAPSTTAGRQGDRFNALTLAESRVALLVAQGLSNKEIAAALGRAEPTVKHQISAAMRKLGVQSRCQLIVRLLR
jgi:DNA-binding NarL/FixJ family response regulator